MQHLKNATKITRVWVFGGLAENKLLVKNQTIIKEDIELPIGIDKSNR